MKTHTNRKQAQFGPQTRIIILVALLCFLSALLETKQVSAEPESSSKGSLEKEASKKMPSNHRMEQSSEADQQPSGAGRQGRQYDGPMTTSGTGSYAALSSDSGAYVGTQLPMTGASYSAAGSTGAGSAYLGSDLSSALGGYSTGGAGGYHDHMARGYPSMHSAGYPPAPLPPPPMSPLTAMFSSSGSSMFPLMAKGFDVSEIICTAIAVAIGAVIVGAPFILLYLFVMNQMGGNGPMMGPNGGGSISLTGPTSSTNVSGRKKRHTSFSEALFRQLSPLVNNEQLASTFKMLIDSLNKYQ